MLIEIVNIINYKLRDPNVFMHHSEKGQVDVLKNGHEGVFLNITL